MSTLSCDAANRLINLRDPVNNDTAWSYDNAGRVTMETNELNNTRSFFHDAAGNLTRKLDRNERVTQYTFDDLGRMTAEKWLTSGNPVPSIAVSTSTQGGPSSEVQRVGFTASMSLMGGTFTLSFGGNTTGTIAYNASAATVKTALEGLASIGSGNVAVVKTADTTASQIWQVTFQGTLAGANQNQITISAGSVSAMMSRTDTQTTDTEGGSGSNNEVQVVTLSNASDGTFRLAFAGQTTAPIAYNASNSTVDSALEALQSVDTVTTTGNAGGPWTVTFTGTHANVNVAQLQGDSAAIQPGTVSRTISYSYDAASELTSATDPDSTYAYTYDNMGRLLTSSNSGTSGAPTTVLTWAYDAASNPTSESVTVAGTADFKNEYTYDNLLRLTRVDQIGQAGGNSVASKRIEFAYNALGLFTGIARSHKPSGSWVEIATTEFTYDTLSRLTNIAQKQGGSHLFTGTSYTYDRMNRITQMASQDGTADYTYDKNSRLTAVNFSYQADESYSYNANGSRTGGSYTVGTNNRLTSDGTYNYTYDDEGNLTKRTKISDSSYREFTWDYRNRLTQVQDKNSTDAVLTDFDYTYDLFNSLLKRSVDSDGPGSGAAVVSRYVYDGNLPAFTFDGSNALQDRYLSAPMIDQIMAAENAGGTILTPLTDIQGSVTDLVNTSGVSQNHIDYSAFGEILSETASSVNFICGFSGMMNDEETATWHALGNTFTSTTGMWNTPVAGPLNPYTFAGQGPPNLVQPVPLLATAVNTAAPVSLPPMPATLPVSNAEPPRPAPLRASGWRGPNIDVWDPSQQASVRAETVDGGRRAVNMVEGLASFVPGAGVGLSAMQLMTGEHLDGTKLTTLEKVFAGADVVLIFLGPLLGMLDEGADMAKSAVKNADYNGPNPRFTDEMLEHHRNMARCGDGPTCFVAGTLVSVYRDEESYRGEGSILSDESDNGQANLDEAVSEGSWRSSIFLAGAVAVFVLTVTSWAGQRRIPRPSEQEIADEALEQWLWEQERLLALS